MARKKLNNEEIFNSIREGSSHNFKDTIPALTTANASDVIRQLEEFPTLKNEFISALTNRVTKTMFFNRLWDNPLKVLKKGMLPFGKTIEQIFVEAGKGINFGSEHYDGETGDDVKDLLGKRQPTVNVDYITENFKKQYKISFSWQQLKGAFLNETGLNDLLSKELAAQTSQAEVEEYAEIKKIINSVDMKSVVIDALDAKSIAKQARILRRKFTFVSNKYNESSVATHTPTNKLVLFLTPEMEAELDVELYATAFNMSKTELIGRIIVIDEFDDPNTQMVIADEDYIQIWETLNEGGEFVNPQGLYINYFLNRWGIFAKCKFCNAVAIKKATQQS